MNLTNFRSLKDFGSLLIVHKLLVGHIEIRFIRKLRDGWFGKSRRLFRLTIIALQDYALAASSPPRTAA